jgi:hypothetical protein
MATAKTAASTASATPSTQPTSNTKTAAKTAAKTTAKTAGKTATANLPVTTKTTKKVAACAEGKPKKAASNSKIKAQKAQAAPVFVASTPAAPAPRTTLAAQAIWPFPVGPKP